MSDSAAPISPSAAKPDRGLGGVPWYLWPNLLSIDAVVVALVWLWCFSVCEQVPILRSTYLLLGLVVWLVYTADRLLDAMRMKDAAQSTPRHRFARRFMVPLGILCAIVLAVAIWLVLFKLQRVLIYHGVVISMMVALYFVMRCTPATDLQAILPKEVFCGIIFALGSTYPVHALPDNFVAGVLTPELIVFAILCALNCTAISVWESREDAANEDGTTIVDSWPVVRRGYMKFAFLLAAIAAWMGVRGTTPTLPGVSPILVSAALSAALIGALGLAAGALSKNLRRALVDLVLLTPLVVVPLLR